jgi:HK97 gp10 family phage protein
MGLSERLGDMAIRAATVTVKWEGDRVVAAVSQAAIRGLEKTARDYIVEMRRLILETPKTGILYGFHQASAPGEPPASHYGTLIRSFRTVKEEIRGRPMMRVISTAEHARYLEFGTSHMAARPFMRPALANVKGQMLVNVGGEVKKAIGPRRPSGAPIP